jgi:hypothetical protein
MWMKTRERIFARDNGLCQCEECRASGNPKPAGEVDHKVPLSQGGSDDDSNLQAINVGCHERKTVLERERLDAERFSTPESADTPLAFLIGVMNDPKQEPRLRVRAAVAAAQYAHVKKGDSGKKDERKEAAEKAGRGKFAPAAPPRLRVVAGS